MRRLKKSLALLLALAMVLSTFAITTVSAQTFSDTSGHWAESWINKWSDKGVINGYEDGTFRPDDFITRAELAKIISTAKGYTALADIAFADVAGDEWYVSDLKKCVAQGVIGGYEDGTFRPDAYITREEASAMFVRAYNVNAIGMLNFADNNDISEWAKTAVTALVGAGVINGYEDGTFLPQATITRAEVVKILDGTDSVVAAFPQATSSTGGTNTVTTIGNLGSSGGGSNGGGGGNVTTPTYKVTFNANGGSFSNGASTASITVGKNGVIGSKAPTPVRSGMLFEGWYTSATAANELNAAYKWDINAAVTRSLTLYAGWYVEGKVVVSFETNGGTPSVPSQTIDSGSYAETPNVALTRDHYTFEGWYTKNSGGTKVNFSSTPIRVNTRFYARWKVNSDYAEKEVNIPNETTGSYQNGTVEAFPPSVIPGETVTIKITPPANFDVAGIPAIKYTSTETGSQVQIDTAAIKYNEETDEYSFVMPEDVQKGSLAIDPNYVAALPTAKPVPTAAPTATIDPTLPTEEPPKVPKYYFSKPEFSGLTVFPAGETIDGLTVSKACDIDGSGKTFNGSGYKYTRRCKLGTATMSFNVDGPCVIMIDAVSASSADREYHVFAGTESLGSFKCLNGATDTATFYYSGPAQTIQIKPLAGINLYGIFVEYNASIPTATPKPTIDPSIKYDINISDNIQNGSIVVNNGEISSDAISSFTWDAESHIPAGAISGETPVFGAGKQTVNLNDKDKSGGTLTTYEDAHWYDYKTTSGETVKFIRGENNPSATYPFTETNQPGGAAFRLDAGQDGYITLNLYIFSGKHFHLYDNNAQSHIEDFTTLEENLYSFTFSCEQSNSYYFWADGSKVGIVSATYSTGILNAKAGQTITVTTKPDSGFKTGSVFTEPETNVSAGSAANTYTFKMPASDVTVTVTFLPVGTVPTPEPTIDPNKEYTVKIADGITGGSVYIVQPTAEPTAAPTAQAPATATPKPTVPPMTVINEEYTFISDDFNSAGTVAVPAFTLLDNGRVYSANGNNVAVNKNKSIIGGEQKYNSLRLKQENNTLLIDLGAASTITVYSNNDLGKDRHIILGTTPGGDDISSLLNPTETEYADSVKYVETKFENVPAGKVYMSATGDLFIAGFTVTPGGLSAASDITAAADEVLVNEMTSKAGQTITVKAVPDNAGSNITITTAPGVTVTDIGNGYYTFTMPASDVVVNATF